MTYTVWDIETTTKTSYKRKANPFDPENFIVSSGWKRKGGQVVGEYYGRGAKPTDWFTKLLQNTTLLVGFNIKFDILHAINEPQNYEAWQEYVASGGNVWDCQLVEYLLKGMGAQHQMMAMDEVAPRYGGNTKIDEVKALWEAGVDTADINEDLLMRYLTGGPDETGAFQEGDIGNTELIFLGQLDKARKANQVKSILLNNGSLLCTIEMERNGMAVNKELGLVLAQGLSSRLKSLTESLSQSLPSDVPFPFKWSSPIQKSALLFGGTVKYTNRMPVVDALTGEPTWFMKDEEQYVLDSGTSTACATYDSVLHGAITKYKSGKKAGEYKTRLARVPDTARGIKTREEEFTYTFPQMTAPNPRWKTAREGVYSVGGDNLKALAGRGIKFLDDLAEATTVSKDLSTYYITTDETTGEQKGMLTLVQPDGVIHHMLNHTKTVTGRFSSSNPNLQNLSKGEKSDVKSVFVSRFPGGSIVQSDFTSLEVYVQAILSGDTQLIDDLRKGLDMHCMRVSQAERIAYETVLELVKVKKDEAWIKKRSKAKNFSFQRAYGAGAKAISEATGIPLEEVEELIRVEEARYPGIVAFNDRMMKSIKGSRKPTNRIVPHPDLPGVTVQPGIGWYRTPDNKLYTFHEHPAPAFMIRDGVMSSFSPPEIKNYAVQGTGGEFAKAAMWLLIRKFYSMRSTFQGKALLVNQVHDAVYLDAAQEVQELASAVLHACMEAASEFMHWYFKWDVPVHVPTETMAGPNMLTAEVLETPEFFNTVATIRNQVRTSYMPGYTPTSN